MIKFCITFFMVAIFLPQFAFAALQWEAGRIVADQGGTEWHRINLENSYTDAAIIMGALSLNDDEPAIVRVRNGVQVDAGNQYYFEYRIENRLAVPTNPLTFSHGSETFGYLVAEKGVHDIVSQDGSRASRWIVGSTNVGRIFQRADFPTALPAVGGSGIEIAFENSSYVLLTQIVTSNESTPAGTRIRYAKKNGFEVRVQEYEDYTSPFPHLPDHVIERVDYVAVQRGNNYTPLPVTDIRYRAHSTWKVPRLNAWPESKFGDHRTEVLKNGWVRQPLIFAQIRSHRHKDALSVRLLETRESTTTAGMMEFDFALQEDGVPNEGSLLLTDMQLNDNGFETVDWLAIDVPEITRPNILFIAVDDLRPDLGVYGFSFSGSANPQLVKTPNINRLAKSGIKFSSAYSQVAVCAASRNSVLSGLRPESTHRWDEKNQLHWGVNEEDNLAENNYTLAAPDSFVPLPLHMQRSDYYTLSVGKVYHRPNVEYADIQGWDTLLTTGNSGTARPEERCMVGSLDLNAVPMSKICPSGQEKKISITHAFDYDPANTVNLTADQRSANTVLQYLEDFRAGTLGPQKNFFFAVGFNKPHAPFVTTTDKLRQYPLQDVKVPGIKPPLLSASTSISLWGEMQKYFYSLPMSTTISAINETVTTISVVDVQRFSVGQQLILYDALPVGSFRHLEHVLIDSINTVAATITVQRGYGSTALPHSAGSIIAHNRLLLSYSDTNPEKILAKEKQLTIGSEIAWLPALHTDIQDSLAPFTNYGLTGRFIDPVDYAAVIQDIRRHYWASISMVDDEVGKLVNAIKNDPQLSKNTIIILWSDHGYYLGEYGQWSKHTNGELATHVPLIVSTPGTRQLENMVDISAGNDVRKAARPQFVELVDLYPTIVQLAGIKSPVNIDKAEYLQGQSFASLLTEKGKTLPWKRYAFSQFEVKAVVSDRHRQVRGTSVRSNKWRYTEWRQLNAGSDGNGTPIRKINTGRTIIGQYGDALPVDALNPAAGLIAAELYYESEIKAYRNDPDIAAVPKNYAHPDLVDTVIPVNYPAAAPAIRTVIELLRTKLKYADKGCTAKDLTCER
ncbi:MAG: sulfatase-like hydrolase/transferase [Gammaproteobacteria bacterium]